jgi:hypothetical protein
MTTPCRHQPRLLDPFRILEASERGRHMAAYEQHLGQRDGTLDLAAKRLSRRESYLEDLRNKPVRWAGELDVAAFQRYFGGGKGPPPDLRTAWLVAAAEANEGECYGVGLELDRFARRHPDGQGAETAYLHLLLQEHYHTRLLQELCRTCGLTVELQRPGLSQRAVIRLMMWLPEHLRWILVLCGEVVGCVVFEILREKSSLFAAEPEVEERLSTLLGEVYHDEILHVAYLRARLSPWAIRIARRIAPLVAGGVMREVPQFYTLGCSRREFVARLRRGLEIPAEIDWLDRSPVPA